MRIQKIQFYTPRNNCSFTKKYVQPDSFINVPKRKRKKSGIDVFSVVSRISEEKRNHNDIILVASRIAKERDSKINGYLKDSKNELKDIQKTAIAHKKQCLGILKKAQKYGYRGTINCDDYNINFGSIDPDTNKPSSINIWDDGRLVQQYKINSLEPFNIEVYDCEVKGFTEEFYITDKGLAVYKSYHKDTNAMKLIIPSPHGFYKIEGQWDYPANSIQKEEELEYSTDKEYKTIYSKYERNNQEHYKYDAKTKSWHSVDIKKQDTLKLSS